MKERNARRSHKEFEKLKTEALERRAAIEKKYKNVPHPSGLDTDPAEKELGEVTKWFGKEVNRIKNKYGID